MKTISILFVAIVLIGSQTVRAAERPNIVVVLTDDVGFSDIGCYGGEIHTPNLDSLAATGLRFTEFYNTSRCCPSRATLLTGMYAHQAGVGHMTELHPDLDGYVGDLNNHCVTIAQVLQSAGYATYMVGKWHVTKFTDPIGPKYNWPLQRGFQRLYGIINGADSYFDPGTLTRDNTMISAFADPLYKPPAGEPYYFTNAIGDHASKFIHEHKQLNPGKPFFLYCAFTAAHYPMQALPRDIEKYKGVYDVGYEVIRQARFAREKQMGLIDPKWDLSPQWGDWEKVKNKEWEARCMQVYAADLDCMDQNVGKIVETLKAENQFDNTLILYLQDNGGNLEATGRQGNTKRADHPTLPTIPLDKILTNGFPKQTRDGWPVLHGTGVMPGPADTYIAYGQSWANVSNTPFREYKHFVHEGGISSPLIAHWPNHIHRDGQLDKQPTHLIDIMTTCVDLAGAQYPKQLNGNDITPMQGVSLLPAFDGKSLPDRPLFWEHEGNRAMRLGDWKLVAKHPSGKWELYNIVQDRTEMHDLASSDPDRVKSMSTQWEAWAKRANVLPWPWNPQYGSGGEAATTGPSHEVLHLRMGANLQHSKAPHITDKVITITAEIIKPASDGVIVADGGNTSGYSLYVKGNHLMFATRHSGDMNVIAADDPLPDGVKEVGATLAKDGSVTITADGKTVASGKVPGLLTEDPMDGLQVGKDLAGTVGDYQGPFTFKGEIGNVTVEMSSP